MATYLSNNYRKATAGTYERYGRQIEHFMNQYLTVKIAYIKPLFLNSKIPHVEMPRESMSKLKQYVMGKIVELKRARQNVNTPK